MNYESLTIDFSPMSASRKHCYRTVVLMPRKIPRGPFTQTKTSRGPLTA